MRPLPLCEIVISTRQNTVYSRVVFMGFLSFLESQGKVLGYLNGPFETSVTKILEAG